MHENDSGHRTVGAGAPGDPNRDETAPAAGDDATGHGAGRARAERDGGDTVDGAGDVVEAVAAFVDDLVEDGGHAPGG